MAAQQPAATAAPAGPVRILLPLARTVYQTNETIDVSVVRSSSQALAKGDLVLTLTGADGSYFNVVRSLPLISGHGGYSDEVGGFFYTSLHMEYGRLRDMNKPYWYLPSWYRMDSDQYRLAQYTSFVNGIQGMMKPPDMRMPNDIGAMAVAGGRLVVGLADGQAVALNLK